MNGPWKVLCGFCSGYKVYWSPQQCLQVQWQETSTGSGGGQSQFYTNTWLQGAAASACVETGYRHTYSDGSQGQQQGPGPTLNALTANWALLLVCTPVAAGSHHGHSTAVDDSYMSGYGLTGT